MRIENDVSFSKLTHLKLQGTFKKVIYLESISELINNFEVFENAYFWGNGTNTLLTSSLIKTPIIKWENPLMFINDYQIIVNGNYSTFKAFNTARNKGLENFLGTMTIPGTIGASIKNNSTFLDYTFFDDLQGIVTLYEGKTKYIKAEDIKRKYRKTDINGLVILAIYKAKKQSSNYKEKLDRIIQYRKKQPLINNLGSVFKNGPLPAYKYVESVLDEINFKNCRMSEKHHNFFEIDKDCTPEELFSMLIDIQNKVLRKWNYFLEFEIGLLS